MHPIFLLKKMEHYVNIRFMQVLPLQHRLMHGQQKEKDTLPNRGKLQLKARKNRNR